ncbi:MAG: cell wall metabolism sensor histidine kinase WalK [Peptococcaceae bacterium]|nr:cell wall metabolism sensor histidine kinase WalK [Peptococcaceae bacterium]
MRRFAGSLYWRPIASYFFLIFVFYVALRVFAGDSASAWGAVLVSLPFAVAFSWMILKRIMRPLDVISEVAKEMARGNLEREIRIYSDDEIGDLARNINFLGHRLKQTINEITEEKDRIHAILNSMADGVVAVDGDRRVLLINPAVERTLNISGKSSRGKDIMGVIRQDEFENSLKVALETQKELTREIRVLTPDPKIFRVIFTPLKGAGRGGVVAVLRDITERRQLDRMRAEFIANISHELRTPLTSVKGFLETLLDGALEDRENALHFLRIINNETDRMKRLIDDLFSLSNIESRRVVPARDRVKIPEVVDKVLDIFRQAAGDRGISLESRLSADFPVIVADEDMITRVIINLVDNAIKYSHDRGEVVVDGGFSGDSEVFFTVADKGIGIPAECLPRIFERLYRVDKARSREYGGSGLGLAIVKHIVEVHGGRIEVASQPGRGSKFTVYLPVM